MVGSGDGVVRVFYDPDRSVNGAKLCAVRTKAKIRQTGYVANMPIISPYSLPMFREVPPCLFIATML
jgi:WD repeat-containing protein 70